MDAEEQKHMKNSQAFVDVRRQKILDIAREEGAVHVKDLAERFGISPLTIRRDIDELTEKNFLERFHGGATFIRSVPSDANLPSSGLSMHKHAIAQRAAAMVEDNDTIFINTSSTALLILRYLTASNVSIITNNAKALFTKKPEDSILIFTGGEVRFPKDAMVGEFAINNLMRVVASKCFLGCSGISVEGGFTTSVLQEATINEIMLKNTKGERVVLADYSKIGQRKNFLSSNISEVNTLITDTMADELAVESLRKEGLMVVQVRPLKRID